MMPPPSPLAGQQKLTSSLVRRVLPLARSVLAGRVGRFAIVLLFVVLGRAASIALPASTRFVVDDVILGARHAILVPLLAVVAICALIQGASQFAASVLVARAGADVVADLRKRVQDRVGRLPVAFYDATPSGVLARRILDDAGAVRNLFGAPVVESLGALLTAMFSLVFLVRISPRLTLLAFTGLVAFTMLSKKGLNGVQSMFMDTFRLTGEVTGRLVESIGGIRVVKGYHAEAHEARAFAVGADRLSVAGMRTATANALLIAVTVAAVGVVTAGTLYLAVGEIAAGRLTLGGFVTFMAFLSFLMTPMFHLSQLGTHATEGLVGLSRVQELLHARTEDENPQRIRSIGPILGHVSFDNVDFSYRPDRRVLTDISFQAPPGTSTALVGPSGAGKSTVVSLIAAFYAPTGGSIRLDDVDLATVRLDSYRTQLGVVFQDSFLFDGSIRDNVVFSRAQMCSDAEIMSAIRIARVDEFAERLPDGYDTLVGERGVKLSMGQRQRIAIARAIVADPRILILDEATSSLDSESEAAIQAGLSYLMAGRTTFVIAHRLSTIRQVDQILVLDGGRIVERGTHDALYAAGGRYYELLTRQQLGDVSAAPQLI